MRIEVDVGELVLMGFRVEDRHRIGDAVRAEMARLLQAVPGPDALGPTRDFIDAGSFTGSPHPEVVGRQVARAVYEGLG